MKKITFSTQFYLILHYWILKDDKVPSAHNYFIADVEYHFKRHIIDVEAGEQNTVFNNVDGVFSDRFARIFSIIIINCNNHKKHFFPLQFHLILYYLVLKHVKVPSAHNYFIADGEYY